MPRSITSGTMSFGLVSIPVKFFTACSSERASFVLLNPETKARLKQQMFDPTTEKVIGRENTVKGYEISKGQFVIFTSDELKALESDRTNMIDIQEFVPANTVDLISIEKTYYLGPGKGGDKAYRLFADSLEKKKVMAVGRWAARGKNQLVVVRPYESGLILHQMYYANEVRSFEEIIDAVAKVEIHDRERNLAEKLIDQLSSDAYDAAQYVDEYAQRVFAAAQTKSAGGDIALAAPSAKAQALDMFEALKASLEQTGQKKKKKPSNKKKPAKKKAG